MNNNLKDLLEKTRTTGETYTYVSMINPKGKYWIGREIIEQFFKEYCRFINVSDDEEIPVIGIAEKPWNFLPVLADVDIKVPESDNYELGEQIYEDSQLRKTIKIYQSVLKTILQDCKPENLYCFVLEKDSYLVKTDNGNFVKNGFHLHFPYTFLNKSDIEKHLFPRVHKMITDQRVFESLGFKDSGELVDKDAVINKFWLMYGSRKEGDNMKPYLLTRIYNDDMEEMTLEDALNGYKIYNSDEHVIKITGKEWYYLPRILSINPKCREIKDVKDNLEIFTKARARKAPLKKDKKTEPVDQVQVEKEVEYICMNLLSARRAENYNDWLNTMWAIYAATNGSENGLEIFLNFSKRCAEKYSEDECVLAWEKIEEKSDGYTIASLYFWAKTDNEVEYTKWKKEKAEKYIQETLTTSGGHNDVAKALYEMYRDQFVCSDIKSSQWYKFNGHIWQDDKDGIGLRTIISGELSKIYKAALKEASGKAIDADDEGEKAKWNTRTKKLQKVVDKLVDHGYKKSVIAECKDVFYDGNFDKLKNKNKYLMAFNNGVYDFKTDTFRPGMPSDRITVGLKINYVEYKEHDDKIQFIYHFLEKIFPDKSVREYFLDVFSEIFIGGNKRKKVYFWTGEGENGKSIMAGIFEKILGELAVKINPSFITSKRGQSGSADPAIARVENGARWVVFQEPDKRDVINIGLLKELSGNDSFFARTLYKEGGEITPMFKMAVICNDPPSVPYSDKATWNRIRVIPFESKFVKPEEKIQPPESFEEQMRQKMFPADMEFEDKIPEMLEPFSWLLINHRKKEKPHREPEKVTLATEIYRKDNDSYRQFLEECIIKEEVPKTSLSIGEIYSVFKDWYRESKPTHAVPDKNDVKVYLIKLWGGPTGNNKWKGYRIRTARDDEEIELTENDLVDYEGVLPL